MRSKFSLAHNLRSREDKNTIPYNLICAYPGFEHRFDWIQSKQIERVRSVSINLRNQVVTGSYKQVVTSRLSFGST